MDKEKLNNILTGVLIGVLASFIMAVIAISTVKLIDHNENIVTVKYDLDCLSENIYKPLTECKR